MVCAISEDVPSGEFSLSWNRHQNGGLSLRRRLATIRGDPQGLELETSLRLTMGGPSFSSFTVMLWLLDICLLGTPVSSKLNGFSERFHIYMGEGGSFLIPKMGRRVQRPFGESPIIHPFNKMTARKEEHLDPSPPSKER